MVYMSGLPLACWCSGHVHLGCGQSRLSAGSVPLCTAVTALLHTSTLSRHWELKIPFLGPTLSQLQYVREAPGWVEMLGSSPHLLLVSRRLEDGIGQGICSWGQERRAELCSLLALTSRATVCKKSGTKCSSGPARYPPVGKKHRAGKHGCAGPRFHSCGVLQSSPICPGFLVISNEKWHRRGSAGLGT